MLDRLKHLLLDSLDPSSEDSDTDADLALQRAAAALCIEMSRADEQVLDEERAGIVAALHECFDLQPEEIDSLVAQAETAADEAVSLFEFTTVLNQHFEHARKVRFVEHLWRVAYADGQLEKHEAHLVRKVADLLHLRHREYIGAKLRAAPSTGQASGNTS